MESTGGSSGSTMTAAAAMPSPSVVADGSKATNYEFDASISEEERRFYLKAYPTVDVVRERKTHCTVCKVHIGTAPVQENGIKMHPILRVTHCNKCHDFYNSGEFSKGEDGSELYCRWCGQGGEVYCCSSCPYVFCKSCIVKNLSRGVVADIEQNENWNCFKCAPKILWPLRAQHWALMNYIEQQKKEIYALNLSEGELKINLGKDRSRCCRLAKAKCGNMSDSMESLDSVASKRSHGSSSSVKKPVKHAATPSPQQMNAAKRAKNNDEVVCTPDLLSMLEPDCQITVSQKPNRPMTTPSASAPKIMSIQQPQAGYGSMTSSNKSTVPPPLVLRNTAIKLRPVAPPPVVRRTIIGPRTPNPGGNGTPVYHTINGYRIDLNSAAQQETFRLPNGKLIQVKRQGPPPSQNSTPPTNNWQQMGSPQPQRIIPQTIASRPVQITQHPYNISVQQQANQHPPVVRYHSNMIGSTAVNQVNHNGTTIQVVNGQISSGPHQPPPQQQQLPQQTGPVRPVMVRHVFPDNPIGQARSGLQDQVFNAMEICTHLTNKVQTLTNSNAYKQARSFLEVKELYIHLSYLLTYAIGRFKSLQDKCLGDMRTLGFGNDADSLENGQLAADKQASDDEDNEIEIVEPKTDLITLDSDDDEPIASTPSRPIQHNVHNKRTQPSYLSSQQGIDVKVKAGIPPAASILCGPIATTTAAAPEQVDDTMDLMSMAQNFLASMLEVELQEGPSYSPGSDSSVQKKQPRKKLTNKPNPTLLKQKAAMERERLEEMKRNDQKLKMKCSVELKKAEEVFPYAKEMLEAKAKEKLQLEKAKQKEKLNDETNSSLVTANNSDEDMNTSSEENNQSESNNTITEDDKTIENSLEIAENSLEIEKSTQEHTDEKDSPLKKSETETSVETKDDVENKSTKKEEKSQEVEKTKEDTEKAIKTPEILETTEDTKSKDLEENQENGFTEENRFEEKLPATPTKDEAMEVDDTESSQTEPNSGDNTKTNSSSKDVNSLVDWEMENTEIPEINESEISEGEKEELEKVVDNEKTINETFEIADKNELPLSPKNNDDSKRTSSPTINDKEQAFSNKNRDKEQISVLTSNEDAGRKITFCKNNEEEQVSSQKNNDKQASSPKNTDNEHATSPKTNEEEQVSSQKNNDDNKQTSLKNIDDEQASSTKSNDNEISASAEAATIESDKEAPENLTSTQETGKALPPKTSDLPSKEQTEVEVSTTSTITSSNGNVL